MTLRIRIQLLLRSDAHVNCSSQDKFMDCVVASAYVIIVLILFRKPILAHAFWMNRYSWCIANPSLV
jgi:hypothetical protein